MRRLLSEEGAFILKEDGGYIRLESDWFNEPGANTPSWSEASDANSPTWNNVAGTGGGSWSEASDANSPSWSNVAGAGSQSWTEEDGD